MNPQFAQWARWVLYLVPSLLIELMCYILAPLVALFIRTEPRTDRVKRQGNATITMDRDYLIRPLMWFQTHDNAVDEWWYGLFNVDSYFKFLREATQSQYDKSWWIRYLCRVHWLYRNCGYGFMHYLLGRDIPDLVPNDFFGFGEKGKGFWIFYTRRAGSFQLEMEIPLAWSRYTSINVGWKEHRGFSRAMYANRIIGLRKYKNS